MDHIHRVQELLKFGVSFRQNKNVTEASRTHEFNALNGAEDTSTSTQKL